jgi:hypothetical protein
MNLLKKLIPDNYIPVPKYRTDSQMASTKNRAVEYLDRCGKSQRVDGAVDVGNFREECLENEKNKVRADWARKAELAGDAAWKNALYYASHPQELKHLSPSEMPDGDLLEMARKRLR